MEAAWVSPYGRMKKEEGIQHAVGHCQGMEWGLATCRDTDGPGGCPAAGSVSERCQVILLICGV